MKRQNGPNPDGFHEDCASLNGGFSVAVRGLEAGVPCAAPADEPGASQEYVRDVMHPAAMIWTPTPSPNFLCSDSVLTELPLRSPSGLPDKTCPQRGRGRGAGKRTCHLSNDWAGILV